MADSLRSGQEFGDYQISRKVGAGGMGEVYEAVRLQDGRRVALKLLSGDLDAVERERFTREGRLAASVTHPNSVLIYGTDEIEGIPVIIMEFMPLGTLQDRVRREGPLPIPQAVDITLQLLTGLKAAANRNVLHRDVKPGNCFVAADGTVKVGDYGLSRLLMETQETRLTVAGSLLGTPTYCSPEQLQGEEVDLRSDIYSLGATLYFLLTGRAPFEETNLPKLISRILAEEPEPPDQYRPEIPSGLTEIILRCLEKRPEKRFKDYGKLRAALLPFSSKQPDLAGWGTRLAAGLLDAIVVPALLTTPIFTAGAVAGMYGEGESRLEALTASSQETILIWGLLVTGLTFLYFVFTEWIWQGSVGKLLLGLRVVAKDFSRAGFLQVSIRALLFCGITASPTLLYLHSASHSIQTISSILSLLLFGVLFVTARDRNYRAGIHEIWSGTRVAKKGGASEAFALERSTGRRETGRQIGNLGPYRLLQKERGILGADLGEEIPDRIWLGHDPSLSRDAWIREYESRPRAVSDMRFNLARPGRLRILDSYRSEEENWDVYEYVPGKPLKEAVRSASSWSFVRRCLLDVAIEMETMQSSGEAFRISADRIWLGVDGHFRLLDFDISEDSAGASIDVRENHRIFDFLHRLAKELELEIRRRRGRPILSLEARDLLERLEQHEYESLENFIESLRRLETIRVEPRPLVRILPALTAWTAIVPLLIPLSILFFVELHTALVNPELSRASTYLSRIHDLTEEGVPSEQLEGMKRYVATRFRSVLPSAADGTGLIDAEEAEIAAMLLGEYEELPPDELTLVRQEARSLIEPVAYRSSSPFLWNLLLIPSLILGISMGMVGIVATAVGIIYPWGLLLRLYGLTVVRKDGTLISRLTATKRMLLIWGPGLIAGLTLVVVVNLSYETRSSYVLQGAVICLLLACLGAYLVSFKQLLFARHETWADRLLGCFVVRR